MRFKTVSGSEYEIRGDKIRRLNALAGKRADGEWIRLHNDPEIHVGASGVLIMDSLRDFGHDDNFTPWAETDNVTTRVTSTVTEVYDD